MVGLLSSHSNAFPFAPLHFRAIQRCLSYNLRNSSSWDEICHLDEDALKDLLWWSHCPLDLPPLSLKEFVPSITLSTDASLSGWGGTLSSGSSASGHWSLEEKQLHINMLELKAIKFCVLSFLDLLRNQSMLLLSDNSSCVFYINKFGGTHSKEMCNLSIEIWDIMIKNNITCLAKHIPGVDNSSADSLSRLSPIPNDFGLSQTAFNLLTSLIPFELNVDMFASRLSNKLERFVSWHNDPFSWRVDAFSFRWSHNLYFFPPISLIGKVVKKFKSDGATNSILITPLWRSLQPLPTILEMLIDDPICISHSSLVGSLPCRRPFNLMAWPISTNVADTREYRRRLLPPSSVASEMLLLERIPDIGKSFIRTLLGEGIKVKSIFP